DPLASCINGLQSVTHIADDALDHLPLARLYLRVGNKGLAYIRFSRTVAQREAENDTDLIGAEIEDISQRSRVTALEGVTHSRWSGRASGRRGRRRGYLAR